MNPVEGLLAALRRSREFFFKHVDRFGDDSWDVRIAPGTMTARETLRHLLVDDRAALKSLQTNADPNYEALGIDETDPTKLKALLFASHAELLQALAERQDEVSINVWGTNKPLVEGLTWYASEDFYHAGQLAMILLAINPEWQYYPDIYGG
ncbi:hypothetical protein BH11ARM2_BH11ARM2_04970 [soil metagenome]